MPDQRQILNAFTMVAAVVGVPLIGLIDFLVKRWTQ